MSGLPVQRAHELAECPEDRRWLIEDLWAAEAVGIVGGEPKCCKSFLALDMVVAVASGMPCLRRFRVAQPGRVVLFAAEDALHVVRRRLDGICLAAGALLADIDVQVITAPSLRLDVDADRRRLTQTVSELRPRMLVLDPFVRLHRVDENVSAEVAPLLAYLRELQRGYGAAVVVVHHARKGAGHARAGQALRGSSEFHAWGDSNLYLRRVGEDLSLSIEHRAAATPPPIAVGLSVVADAVALEVRSVAPDATPCASISVLDAVENALALATAPLPLTTLRQMCRARTKSVCDALAALSRDGRVIKRDRGYELAQR
jgi:AAA domain-containing protein